MNHHCKYLVAHCIDFRLVRPINNYLDRIKILGNCDLVSMAGGVKNRDFLLDQIDISAKLHGIEEIILFNHTDCGAYGGSGEFNSLEEEKNFHIQELIRAKEAILNKHPHLKVNLVLAEISQSKVIFRELS